jgi:hypothetical protein
MAELFAEKAETLATATCVPDGWEGLPIRPVWVRKPIRAIFAYRPTDFIVDDGVDQACEDILWALANSAEFALNH